MAMLDPISAAEKAAEARLEASRASYRQAGGVTKDE